MRIELGWKSQSLPRETMMEANRAEMEITEIAKRDNGEANRTKMEITETAKRDNEGGE
jgi:hypothetical protein